MSAGPQPPQKGRGATFNPGNRFRRDTGEAVDDGWTAPAGEGEVAQQEQPPLKTSGTLPRPRPIMARNAAPDIPFTQSINPYQGCEHGCVYCYARPSHAYLDLSPGLDFETKLFAKPDAAALLIAELAKPGYVCDPIAMGTNTDPYQPIEREWKITRQILEVLSACDHPVSIVTKSALVERDIDLLAPMAAQHLPRVYVSITALDRNLARKLEPRAAAPHRRLAAVQALSDAGIPVGVMTAPIIPQLTDKDLEAILDAASANGARYAGWTLVRLPHEVKDLFRDWLAQHYPLRAEHVMRMIQQMRGGRDNDPQFGSRMRGQGLFADLISRRFDIACQKLRLKRDRAPMDISRFRPPRTEAQRAQLTLF